MRVLDVPMRRRLILDTLREHPLLSARGIHRAILDETGGAPAAWTGALYIPPDTARDDLLALERAGLVERVKVGPRAVWWRLTEDATDA